MSVLPEDLSSKSVPNLGRREGVKIIDSVGIGVDFILKHTVNLWLGKPQRACYGLLL